MRLLMNISQKRGLKTMALTADEIEELQEDAEVINQLNLNDFLIRIKEKAEQWIKDLTNG